MLIGKEVDAPPQLLAALREERLVIFAGAGISMGAPTNLPDFERLADDVGAQTAKRQNGEAIDAYLGRVESLGANVQHLTRKRLSDPASVPRSLHESLVGLFSDASALRIITTNFDPHLTTECVKRFGDEVEVYYGPALPMGRDFRGLAYLHGSLTKRAPLVLTDRDFGRAYMVDAWATRLLLEVFQHFTVLFVGYSHDDPVMKYLARSLVGESHRFVMTLPGQDAKWTSLGIEPVHFPPRQVGDEYGALDDFFAAWVKRIRMGALEHEVRIRDIVTAPVPSDKEDQDYVRGAFDDPVLLPFFGKHADSIEWLRWAESFGSLKSLFTSERVATPAEPVFAKWFAEKYAIKHAAAAVHLVSEKGGVVSPSLWVEIAWQLGSGEQIPSVEALNKWVLILIASAQDHYWENWLSSILVRYLSDSHAIVAKLLFRYLVRPLPRIEKAWVAPEESQGVPMLRVKLRTRGEADQLLKAWVEFFVPRLPEMSGFLRTTLLDAITEAHSLVLAETDGGFDPLSFRRSAIEPHGQDALHDDFDFIID